MDLVTPIFLLLTGFAAICQSLSPLLPDESKKFLDPTVFDMKSPPGFIKFLPTKDEDSSENTMKHPWAWSMNNFRENMKFPDWFHFRGTKLGVDKKTDKVEAVGEKPDMNKMKWNEEMYGVFSFIDPHNEDKFDPKEIFPPYYDVFGSNAYPSWMAMPIFQNAFHSEKKEGDDVEIKIKDLNVQPRDTVSESPVIVEKANLNIKEEVQLEEDPIVEKSSESFIPDDQVTINSNSDPIPEGEGMKVITEEVSAESEEGKGSTLEEGSSLVSKSIDDEPYVSTNINNSEATTFDSVMLVPMALIPNSDITPQSSSIDKDFSAEPTNPDIEDKVPKKDDGLNLLSNIFLQNLLQKVKPSDLIFPAISSGNKDSFPSPTQIAAMLIASKETPTPESRSIISGNNVVFNNADKLPNVDQNINAASVPNVPNSPNNQPLPSTSQNQGGIPNSQPNLLPTQPGLSNNVPNRNPGNALLNPPTHNYIAPNAGSVNQNNNYLQNPGQSLLGNLPYTNVPVNYVLANIGQLPPQGNLINGQTLQQNPGQNNAISYNNNMALVSPGMNPGQNVYAMVPLVNSGNVGNVNPNAYLNGNSNWKPNGYQVNSLPLYNLVPVNANVLLNTKDEEDE